MGLIWGRNHDRGNPLERVRLTYFTPIVDILEAVREKHGARDEVALPAYPSSARLSAPDGGSSTREVVSMDMSEEPWTALAREAIRQHHHFQADIIQSHFPGDGETSAGAALSLPELSRSSSVRSGSGSMPESAVGLSAGDGVCIVGEGEGDAGMMDVTDAQEPIRSKAKPSFSQKHPGLLAFDWAVA
jgi:hypothetical protein